MTLEQKKVVEKYLVGQGVVRGGGTTKYGGFLGMLAPRGVSIATDLISKTFGKELHVKPAPGQRRSLPPTPLKRGTGMYINPPPFFGSWYEYRYKKTKFKDVSLSHFDLINWSKYLNIPIKGIFSRNEEKPLIHSPCIFDMDDFESMGTHWVCCWRVEKR